MTRKNPHAVAIGRKGGNARRDRMTPAARSAAASAAARAKWAGTTEDERREALSAAHVARRKPANA